ncbi:hypothetical protein HKX48_003426 [Thoreauomyces humboldtii]|nr:hypothetical protein HKX48_003426 [Thoreauomyces humboldtii]
MKWPFQKNTVHHPSASTEGMQMSEVRHQHNETARVDHQAQLPRAMSSEYDPNGPKRNFFQKLVHRIHHPDGVSPRWKKVERIVGRIGFGAKGVVYGLIGGLICASASKMTGNQESSPKGAFVLIGSQPAGNWALFVLLLALWNYSLWRFWEFLCYQGRDATFSAKQNFFRFRLSPLVSGFVYVAYSYYIMEMLIGTYKNKAPSCYPDCWRTSNVGKAGLILMGIAFAIACITQLQNALTKKWHSEIRWEACHTKFERFALFFLGHVGYLGRAGLFVFVSVLMFRALVHPVNQTGDPIADGISQLLEKESGRPVMWIIGLCLVMYGLFCELCTYYRNFPTPPPSGKPWVRGRDDQKKNSNETLPMHGLRH